MARLRKNASDHLLRSGVELSLDRYEMMGRAEAGRMPADGFDSGSSVLLLTGWVARFKLWLAQRIRPRRKVSRGEW